MPGLASPLESLAQRAVARLTVRRALALANQTAVVAAFGAVLAVLLARQLLPGGSAWGLAPLVVLFWGAVCAGLAWLDRPDPYTALAHWDSVSSTGGSLASAWWFVRNNAAGPGEQLHLRAAEEIVLRRGPALPQELAPGRPARTWWWLVIIPVIVGSGLGRRSLSWEERPITAAMKETAAGLAQDLAILRERLRDESPSADAQPEAKSGKLEDLVSGAEKLLAQPGHASAGEMLDGLEDRARKIEDLAREFRGNADWAPPAVVEELERHADTAALAGQIRERNALGGAAEASRLAELSQSGVAADRLQQALKSAVGKANPDEGRSAVVHELAEAETHLQARQGEQAGDDFRQLSEHFRGLARQEDARKELEALTAKLREGAERLTGSARENTRQSVAANEPPPGAQALDDQAPPPAPGESVNPPPVPQGSGKSPSLGGNAAPMPGPPDAPVPGQATAPIPGTTAPPPSATLTLQAPVPGEASPPSGPMLSAPVPGSNAPGAPGQTAGLQPGLNAGEGTAPMTPAPSKTLASARDDRVATKVGAEGESQTRAVRGNQVRAEQATVATRQASGATGPVEESAMDEQALPASRREQVRRYFNALRESAESAAPRSD